MKKAVLWKKSEIPGISKLENISHRQLKLTAEAVKIKTISRLSGEYSAGVTPGYKRRGVKRI